MLYETNMKQWSEIQSEFKTDGFLRDIYAENINQSIWEKFIVGVKGSGWHFEFSHGNKDRDLPDDLYTIKKLQETDPTTLKLWIDENVQLNCYFFIETEIELDVSPNEIQTEAAYSQLVGFLKWLSGVTGSEVKFRTYALTSIVWCGR